MEMYSASHTVLGMTAHVCTDPPPPPDTHDPGHGDVDAFNVNTARCPAQPQGMMNSSPNLMHLPGHTFHLMRDTQLELLDQLLNLRDKIRALDGPTLRGVLLIPRLHRPWLKRLTPLRWCLVPTRTVSANSMADQPLRTVLRPSTLRHVTMTLRRTNRGMGTTPSPTWLSPIRPTNGPLVPSGPTRPHLTVTVLWIAVRIP
jgi:hypothetical protein